MPSDSAEFTIVTDPSVVPNPVRLAQWPLRHEPRTACSILLVSLGIGLLTTTVTESPLLGLSCLLVLWIAAWRFWIPIHYELGPAGITQRVLWQQVLIPWSYFVRFEENGDFVVLMRDTELNPWTSIRAVHLYVKNERESVLAVFNYYLRHQRLP